MDVKTALAELIAAVDLVTYEEHIAVITEAIKGESGDGADWKQKFEDLEEKYRSRFVEMLENSTNETKEKNAENNEIEVDLESLDFDGSTE